MNPEIALCAGPRLPPRERWRSPPGLDRSLLRGSVEPAHLADDLPLGVRNRLDRQAPGPRERHADEASVGLDLVETDRCRELSHRGDVDGAPGGVGRIRMRLRGHLDDADDRALLAGVVEERLLALLHGAQIILGRKVADAGPLRPVTPFGDLLGP